MRNIVEYTQSEWELIATIQSSIQSAQCLCIYRLHHIRNTRNNN